MTKDSDAASGAWDLFVRLGFATVQNMDLIDILAEPDDDEFATDGPQDPKTTLTT